MVQFEVTHTFADTGLPAKDGALARQLAEDQGRQPQTKSFKSSSHSVAPEPQGAQFVLSISDEASDVGRGPSCPKSKPNPTSKPLEFLKKLPGCTITVEDHDQMLEGLKTTTEGAPADTKQTSIPPEQIPGFLQVPSGESIEEQIKTLKLKYKEIFQEILNRVYFRQDLQKKYLGDYPTTRLEIDSNEKTVYQHLKDLAERIGRTNRLDLVEGEDENDIEYYWTPLGDTGHYACQHLCVKVKKDPTAVVPGILERDQTFEPTDPKIQYLWVYFQINPNDAKNGVKNFNFDVNFRNEFSKIEGFIANPYKTGVLLMTTPHPPFKTGGGGKHPRKAKNTKRGKRDKSSKRGKSGKKGKKSKRGRRSRRGRKN